MREGGGIQGQEFVIYAFLVVDKATGSGQSAHGRGSLRLPYGQA